jgi:hypothetical protein
VATTTANQALPYPQSTDTPADTPLFMQNLATALEKKLVMVFASMADRDAKIITAVKGMFCITIDTMTGWWYDGGTWVKVLPVVQPAITSGGTVPDNATGANGDIYFKI